MHRALKYVAAALLVVSSARADTEACARTLERARELHAAGKLHDAIRAMDACTACDALADVCASTKNALVSGVPKLSVTVHGCDGAPLDDASVLVDGSPVPQGDTIELDPGAHTVRAELAGHREEQTVLVFEHESRRAALMLPSRRERPIPASVIFFGALSGVTFATAAALWAWAATPDAGVLSGPYAQTNEIHTPQLTHGDLELAGAITLAVGRRAHFEPRSGAIKSMVTAFWPSSAAAAPARRREPSSRSRCATGRSSGPSPFSWRFRRPGARSSSTRT